MTRAQIEEIIKDIDVSILGIDYICEFINDVLHKDIGTNDYDEVNKVLKGKPYTYITTGETYHTAEEMVYGIVKQTIGVVIEAEDNCIPDEWFEEMDRLEKAAEQGDMGARIALVSMHMYDADHWNQ